MYLAVQVSRVEPVQDTTETPRRNRSDGFRGLGFSVRIAMGDPRSIPNNQRPSSSRSRTLTVARVLEPVKSFTAQPAASRPPGPGKTVFWRSSDLDRDNLTLHLKPKSPHQEQAEPASRRTNSKSLDPSGTRRPGLNRVLEHLVPEFSSSEYIKNLREPEPWNLQ